MSITKIDCIDYGYSGTWVRWFSEAEKIGEEQVAVSDDDGSAEDAPGSGRQANPHNLPRGRLTDDQKKARIVTTAANLGIQVNADAVITDDDGDATCQV